MISHTRFVCFSDVLIFQYLSILLHRWLCTAAESLLSEDTEKSDVLQNLVETRKLVPEFWWDSQQNMILSSILYEVFKVHHRFYLPFSACRTFSAEILSAIRKQNPFYPLITGKTSYENSISLLVWVSSHGLLSMLPVLCKKPSGCFFWENLAATCFPMPSPA